MNNVVARVRERVSGAAHIRAHGSCPPRARRVSHTAVCGVCLPAIYAVYTCTRNNYTFRSCLNAHLFAVCDDDECVRMCNFAHDKSYTTTNMHTRAIAKSGDLRSLYTQKGRADFAI